MAARAEGNVPGEAPTSQAQPPKSEMGAAVNADAQPVGALPQLRRLAGADWGKLPPKVAQGLLEAQRADVNGEYRNQVETYFRAIAEMAREKKP